MTGFTVSFRVSANIPKKKQQQHPNESLKLNIRDIKEVSVYEIKQRCNARKRAHQLDESYCSVLCETQPEPHPAAVLSLTINLSKLSFYAQAADEKRSIQKNKTEPPRITEATIKELFA